ncbi:MAG: N,N-dimethylformamidase [Kiloniellales bacterium]
MNQARPYLTGYADEISVAPGETLSFMASSNCATRVEAQIVRTICGDRNPNGPGFKETPVASGLAASYPVTEQVCRSGSHVLVPGHPLFAALDSFSAQAVIWPTTPTKGRQGLLTCWDAESRRGFGMILAEDGSLGLILGDGQGEPVLVTSKQPLIGRVWCFVAASYDAASGTVTLLQALLDGSPEHELVQSVRVKSAVSSDCALVMAGWQEGREGQRVLVEGHYNGKIERPRLGNRALDRAELERLRSDRLPSGLLPAVVGAWDFSQDISGTAIIDVSPNRLHGEAVNLPTRAMTSSDWQPEHSNWVKDPERFAAIHFHDDDIYDAAWQPTVTLTVPDDLPSGLYACRLSGGGKEDRIPFIVRPPRDRATAEIAVLASSATWLAYANLNPVPFDIAELLSSRVIVLDEPNLLIDAHPEWGPSLYDQHSDGSGVCYSSLLRPILNMRPGYVSSFGGAGSSLREFNADTHLLDWLEAKGFAYDLISDHDLDREGLALLKRYRTVMTASHSEYWSTAMWDAAKAYSDQGGRMMVLGGNGFYWRIAFHRSLPHVIEVRRSGPAIRTWETAPGEDFQSFDGLRGGLWRAVGRPPQSIQGTGFVAEGFDVSSGYRRNPDSRDPRAGFVFEGIGPEEVIGDFGLQGGGAAGVELDRADKDLGTPQHALVLATSTPHSESYRLVNEEVSIMIPNVTGPTNERIAADLVFFETRGGGAVFTTGSIAWCGSLSAGDYANNVSRISENVLRRFLSPEPFEMPTSSL